MGHRRSRWGSPWSRYSAAVVAVGTAAGLEYLLWPFVKPSITPLFTAAVMFSAYYGGIGPGLLATLLAGLASAFFFMTPVNSLDVGWDDALRLALFLAVGVFINSLSERRDRAEAKLREANETAVRANEAKDRFLAMLGHELRNPLTPVLVAASAAEADPHLPPDVRESMAMIRRNVELEARLIDDLLDVTRITRNKLRLETEVVDVHALARHVAEICRSQIEEKGLDLVLDLAAPSHHVRGDPARLQQVLWNLLKNAAKFTPPGGRVSVQTGNEDREQGGQCLLRVRVSDSGIGIEPELLPRVFDPFEQGKEAVTRQFGGLGLGLSISKSLVMAHGGELTAASEGAWQGATFTVCLPATAPATMTPAAPAAVPVAEERGPVDRDAADLRVLLVEDHPDTLRAMARLLKSLGCSVTTAGSVAVAEAAVEAREFDLVVSDLGLPDGNGIDLMRHLRSRHGLTGIAVSGYGTNEDLRATREAGFVEHLTKPITVQSLESAVRRAAAEAAARVAV